MGMVQVARRTGPDPQMPYLCTIGIRICEGYLPEWWITLWATIPNSSS